MQRPWTRRSELNPVAMRSVMDVRRGTSRQRGYDAAWDRVAKARRQADSWLCQPCLGAGRVTASNEVDHIVPLHVRTDWRLEFDNTQVICRSCHQRKTKEDNERYGSSEAHTLSAEQQQARREAQALEQPPRAAA